MHVRDQPLLGRRCADARVQPERFGDLLVEEDPDAPAGDAAHDLAEQPAEGQGVIPKAGAGLPGGSSRSQSVGDRVVVVPASAVQPQKLLRTGEAKDSGRVGEHVPDQHLLLAARRESRPVGAHWRVDIDLSPVHQDLHAQRGESFGQRHQHRAGVRRPWLARPGRTTPKVNDRHAVDVGAKRTPAVAQIGHVLLERLAHGLEARGHVHVHGGRSHWRVGHRLLLLS
jgi:hypothetical protein